MVDLARRRYPNNFDIETSERWVRSIVLTNPLLYYAARTDKAFLVAFLQIKPWLPADPEVNVSILCAEEDAGWDPIRLCRASMVWSRKRNAIRWFIATETTYDVKPIALRLGAEEQPARYQVELRKE